MEVEKKFKMAMETISWAVGFVDTVAVHASSVYDSGRLFADGIGDVSVLDESEEVIRRACLGLSGIPYLTNLVWEDRPATSKVNGAYTVEEATFDAPFPHFLPKECHRAHFQLVRPTKGPVKGKALGTSLCQDAGLMRVPVRRCYSFPDDGGRNVRFQTRRDSESARGFPDGIHPGDDTHVGGAS